MFFDEKIYLKAVRENPRQYPGPNELFEDHFEFQSLPYSVYRRFIELLLPETNHFFRKTSKHNYQQCLDLRGIEFQYVQWDGHPELPGGTRLHMLKMTLNLNKVPTNWTKWLVVTGSVCIDCRRYGSGIEKLDFVNKSTSLLFYKGFDEKLEYLIHPGLEEVYITGNSIKFEKLLRFLNKLNVCPHLEKIDIWNVNVTSAAAFKQLKQQLEQLARRHPHAQIDCNLGYKKVFKIHENVLCHYPKRNVFVKDYNFENLPQ